MSEILKFVVLPHGGTLTVTTVHIIEEYKETRVCWFHREFLSKVCNPNSLTYKMWCDVYGETTIKEIINLIETV